MNIYTVSFFGHRIIDKPFLVEERIEKIIRDIICSKEYTEFLVGRNGDFDQIVSSVIRRLAREYDYGNTALVLVLPYIRAEYRDNEESFLNYYDDVKICAESSGAHFKSAIQICNKTIVDRSDLVVCCVERKSGGAYKTMQYANKNGKRVIDIADYDPGDEL